MWFKLFVVQLAFVILPASVIFEDCGSAYLLYTVDIEGCDWSLPCYVTAGEEVPVYIEFFADFASLQLDQDVVININLVNLNTDVTPERCKTVDCPVKTNAFNSYISKMKVPHRMALNHRGYLRWRVYNENNQLVLCYNVLVHTQSPLQKKLRQVLSAITPEHANLIVDSLDWDNPEPNINENFLQKLVSQYYKNKNFGIHMIQNATTITNENKTHGIRI